MNNNETNIIQREDELLIPHDDINLYKRNCCLCNSKNIYKILTYIFGIVSLACFLFGLLFFNFFPNVGPYIFLFGSIGLMILWGIIFCLLSDWERDQVRARERNRERNRESDQ